jgi:ParB family transcriptional regulator, chromosome partitioning protein
LGQSPISVEVASSISISQIQTSWFYERSCVAEIEELASSISRQGLIQPIIVRLTSSTSAGPGEYSIVAGNRRFNACKALGWKEIPARVIVASDKVAFELSIAENIQRKSLNPIEEAYAFQAYQMNYGWGGISDLAFRIGKSISYVDRRMRLLGLPSDIVELVAAGKMSPSAADELLPIQDQQQQSALAHMVEVNRLSTRRMRLLKRKLALYSSRDRNLESAPSQFGRIDDITQATFDKSISIMRNAMRDLDEVISKIEENWIVYELLMEHRRILHGQIDILIKEKKKL